MKRKREEDSEDDSTDTESDTFSGDELSKSDGNEISQMIQQLPKSIPRGKALDFLHSIATSKDILYWNLHGEMTYHQRRIPVTSMEELIEYALLPYNLDVRTPRGLKTFTDGLSELDIDKKLVRNKRLLADLIARQPGEEDTDDSETESQTSDESHQDDDEETEEKKEEEEREEEEREEEEKEAESSDEQESSESDDGDQRECHVCESNHFHEISVVQCPRCLWREGYYCRQNQHVECDVCAHVFPVNVKTTKTKFCRCRDCDAVHELSLKFNKLKLIDGEHESKED